MDTQSLLKEIETAFPIVEMPSENALLFHKDGCHPCADLRIDLEEYRNKDITGETIRMVHQELYHFSAKALLWILPYYLRFCLTPEAAYSKMETEFLIYNLNPAPEFQQETLERFSKLNKVQVNCLIYFLEWCFIQKHWKEYCPRDIEMGIKFLQSITECEKESGN